MESGEIYVTLISNTLSHDNNTSSDFTTRLQTPLILAGDQWVVGLTEISVPTPKFQIDWDYVFAEYVEDQYETKQIYLDYFISNGEIALSEMSKILMAKIDGLVITHRGSHTNLKYGGNLTVVIPQVLWKRYHFNDSDGTLKKDFEYITDKSELVLTMREIGHITISEIKGQVVKEQFFIKSGSYQSTAELVKALNKIGGYYFDVLLTKNKFVRIKVKQDGHLMLFPKFSKFLGFGDKKITIKKEKSSKKPPTLEVARDIFVYSPIVSDQRTGDTLTPLLRSLSFTVADSQASYHVNLENPYYSRVSQNFIEDIRIMIADHAGKSHDFTDGRTLVVLHFKKASHH
ncbi:hypothetical protein GQR58_023378 [Nymphon striatum]|nr:hypothetical protein GQR58_023378 [Nymphon striatum]